MDPRPIKHQYFYTYGVDIIKTHLETEALDFNVARMNQNLTINIF
jgi:hypothetical protein